MKDLERLNNALRATRVWKSSKHAVAYLNFYSWGLGISIDFSMQVFSIEIGPLNVDLWWV